MELHNQLVEVGDRVYDLLERDGRVVSVEDDSFTVRFSTSRVYLYDSSGQRLGPTPSRFPPLLYWQNPIVMIPVKGDARWSSMKELFLRAYEIIKGI